MPPPDISVRGSIPGAGLAAPAPEIGSICSSIASSALDPVLAFAELDESVAGVFPALQFFFCNFV